MSWRKNKIVFSTVQSSNAHDKDLRRYTRIQKRQEALGTRLHDKAHDKAFCFLEILAKYTIFLVIGKYDFMLSYFLFVSKLLVILLI